MKRKEVEKVLREETCGKSLAEVMEVVSQIYFRKECGLFEKPATHLNAKQSLLSLVEMLWFYINDSYST
ncbi:hypothetical protein PAMP_001158 [Pampus punctatissimus]